MRLEPPPHASVTSVTSVTGSRPVGQGRKILLVVPFADKRAEPQRCGMKKNGYNIDTADIQCSEPPNQWLAALLTQELRAAGFGVTADPAQAGAAALRLDGTLLRFFPEPDLGAFTFSPEADIELQLIATDRTGLYAQRNFYIKGRETALSGLESNFRRAAESAVRQMLTQVVAAVVELVQKYPQLGLPPPVARSTQARLRAPGPATGLAASPSSTGEVVR